MQKIYERAIERFNADHPQKAPESLVQSVVGDWRVGQMMAQAEALPRLVFTGSSRTGEKILTEVEGHGGQALLELGGNTPFVITESAQNPDAINEETGKTDVDFHVRAVKELVKNVLTACGQRCSTPRRAFIVGDRAEGTIDLIRTQFQAFDATKIRPDMDGSTMGPLINKAAFERMQALRTKFTDAGIEVIGGEQIHEDSGGYYVTPMMVVVPPGVQFEEMKEETFAPILYVQKVATLIEAVEKTNDSVNHLTGAIWAKDPREVNDFDRNTTLSQHVVNGNTSGGDHAYGGTWVLPESGRVVECAIGPGTAREFFCHEAPNRAHGSVRMLAGTFHGECIGMGTREKVAKEASRVAREEANAAEAARMDTFILRCTSATNHSAVGIEMPGGGGI